jgi:hypothetical protein
MNERTFCVNKPFPNIRIPKWSQAKSNINAKEPEKKIEDTVAQTVLGRVHNCKQEIVTYEPPLEDVPWSTCDDGSPDSGFEVDHGQLQ